MSRQSRAEQCDCENKSSEEEEPGEKRAHKTENKQHETLEETRGAIQESDHHVKPETRSTKDGIQQGEEGEQSNERAKKIEREQHKILERTGGAIQESDQNVKQVKPVGSSTDDRNPPDEEREPDSESSNKIESKQQKILDGTRGAITGPDYSVTPGRRCTDDANQPDEKKEPDKEIERKQHENFEGTRGTIKELDNKVSPERRSTDGGNQTRDVKEPDEESVNSIDSTQRGNFEGTESKDQDSGQHGNPKNRSTENAYCTPQPHREPAVSSAGQSKESEYICSAPFNTKTGFDRRTSIHVMADIKNNDDGRLLFCRLIILLTTSCSGIMRAFIHQKVKQNGPEYTLREFLDDNSPLFYNSPVNGLRRQKINKIHEYILYKRRQGIEDWDLSLLSFVATDMCSLPYETKVHFQSLREVRNFLAHVPNATLPEREYGYHLDTITAAYSELLKLIDDKGTREELTGAFIKSQRDTAQLNVCKNAVVEIKDWEEVDRHRERLNMSEEDPAMMKTLEAVVDAMKKRNATPEVLDIVISIIVRNVGASEERFIIKELLTHLDPHHRSSNPTSDTSATATAETAPSLLHHVGPAIEKAIKELLVNDREIEDVQYGCKVRIKCHSYEGVKDLVFKTIQGEVTKVFNEVERNFHKFSGCENAKIDVILTEDDYCSFITKLGKE